MNERIMKLAIQAREYAESKPDIYAVAYDKKFSELIVRECADYVQFYYKDHACEIIAHDMKQHFGVEE